ncbi:potassium transporter TrkA [Parafrankia colletiae]|uniref:Potassium transporter TrkA n=1 Tax=Parafrankia colletiae TaxID=573497 RepID=A0A1S1RKI6_9ACTN|nr:NAD(P)H-binding protein [Parafrankia colletiae]MCK9899271.1 NAD(P)H-binding protein [Frankia sp. Cpl3]OHV45935.1 potassium transporter TrkA [Parafrankia colletiae]
MARIVVLGAGGQVGRSIVAEAVKRGHEVTAVDQDQNQMKSLPRKANAMTGDVTSRDVVAQQAQGADVVVIALAGCARPEHANVARVMVDVASKLGNKAPSVIHVGNGGLLENTDGERIVDTQEFPAGERKEALDQADALDVLRAAKGSVKWSFITPPPRNFGPGRRREAYRTAGDRPVMDSQGNMGISHEDFAIAVLDEAEKPKFRNKRYTVGY